MADFEKRWRREYKEPIIERVKEAVRPQPGLRDRINTAQRSMKTLIARLDAKTTRLKEHDSKLFQNIVSSMQRHDTGRASAYSNELAEVRKITRNVTQVKLVLEQINLRMGTVQDFGDVVTSISPVVSVVRGMRGSMQGIMPEAGSEMTEIGNTLSGLMTDAGQFGGSFPTIESASEESEKILAEASALVEMNSDDKFPEISAATDGTESADYNQ